MEAAKAVAEEYDADVYLYSGSIDESGFGRIVSEVAQAKSRDNALLILTTRGGDANAAYNIARVFQKTYKGFLLHTPGYCKSAGTLIALGADRLIMGLFSELGPLDVQLYKPNEIMSRKSGLLTGSSFDRLQEVAFELYQHFMLRITTQSDGLISFQVASELSAQMASNLLAPIYRQIDPDVVGSDHRDVRVAKEYGHRLANASGNANHTTVMHLVNDYPSHDFIIDKEEAGRLFNRVENESKNLRALVHALGDSAYGEQRPGVVKALTAREEEEVDADDSTGEQQNADDAENATTGGMAGDRGSDWPRDSEEVGRQHDGNSANDAPADSTRESESEGPGSDSPEPSTPGPLKVV